MQAEIQLPAILTIYEVQAVATQWLPLVKAQPTRLLLDVSALEQLDGAGFQLLVSLMKALPKRSCQIKSALELQVQSAWLVAQLQALDLVVPEVVC